MTALKKDVLVWLLSVCTLVVLSGCGLKDDSGENDKNDAITTNGESKSKIKAGAEDSATLVAAEDQVQEEEAAILDHAFVVTTDYTAGSFASFALNAPDAVKKNIGSIHSDATARSFNGLIYVVNRLGQDNIQVLDPAQNFKTVKQFSVGAGTNPQDIAFASEKKAYISRQNAKSVLVVDPTTGKTITEIDLSGFADSDGIPEAGAMIFHHDRLYVALGRLDSKNALAPTDKSLIAVIDNESDKLVDLDEKTDGIQAITLGAANPIGKMILDHDSNALYIACVGVYGVQDGGIDKVSLETSNSTGLVVKESALGGDLGDFVRDGERFYTIVSDANYVTSVVSIAEGLNAKPTTLLAGSGYDYSSLLAASSDELLVANRSKDHAGVTMINPKAEKTTPTHIETGLPPAMLVLYRIE